MVVKVAVDVDCVLDKLTAPPVIAPVLLMPVSVVVVAEIVMA